jgi:c-di-AMP phosphodiesterase-like protein
MNNTDSFDPVHHDDGLTESSPNQFNDCDITHGDVSTMKNLLEEQYGKYLKNPDGENVGWEKTKKHAESVYGLSVQCDAGILKIIDKSKEKTRSKEYENARKLIYKHQKDFISLFEKDLPELHDHFLRCLQMDRGRIKYNPPDPAPIWEVSR